MQTQTVPYWKTPLVDCRVKHYSEMLQNTIRLREVLIAITPAGIYPGPYDDEINRIDQTLEEIDEIDNGESI